MIASLKRILSALSLPSLQRTIALRLPADPERRFSNRRTSSTTRVADD